MRYYVNIIKLFLIVVGLGLSAVSLAITEKSRENKEVIEKLLSGGLTGKAKNEIKIRTLRNMLYSEKIANGEALFDELIVLQRKAKEQ